MSTRTIVRRLEEIVGHDNVFDSPEALVAHSYDATALPPQRPVCVVRPNSPAEISAIVGLANETGTPLVPRGSGTGLSGGALPMEGSVVVLMAHRNRILEIDPDNLTVTVEPGVITAKLQQAVDALGFLYPPDPGSAAISTIGGNVAENSGGLRGLKYGVTKNYVMGLEVVLPTGEILWTGGKSAKDVAGYNLRDVLVGSEGTLGIITKILLRILPKPESSRTLLAAFPEMESAAAAVSAVISARILPAMLEFLDDTTIRCVEEYARLGLPTDAGALLLAETDGHPEVVGRDSARIAAIFTECGASSVAVASTAAESDRLKVARRSAFTSLARVRPTTIMEDVAVPRTELAALVRKIREIGSRNDIRIGTFGHAGDGNLHPNYLTDERDAQEFRRAHRTVMEVEEAAIALGGTITGEHGIGLFKKPLLEKMVGSPSMMMMRRLKEVLDPNLILNPGKILDCEPRCEGRMPRSRDQIRKFEDVAWI